MTPAPPQPALPRARIRTIWTALLGVLLLAALFLPARGPVTHGVTMEWRPSAELAGVLFLVAMAALAGPRLVAERGFAFVLALLVVGAALLNLADTATPTLLGPVSSLCSPRGAPLRWNGHGRCSSASASSCSSSAKMLLPRT